MTESIDLSGKDKDELLSIFIKSLGNQKRELWMWRGLVILLLFLNLCIGVGSSLWQQKQIGEDNTARAENWQAIKSGIEANKNLLLQNAKSILETTTADSDGQVRHWQAEADGQERLRGMLNKNREAIIRVDEHLRQCTGCHSHPEIK